MPKVSVYLPDELYRAARAAGLSISALTQRAVERSLKVARTDEWVERVGTRPARVTTTLDTAAALDGAREDFGA